MPSMTYAELGAALKITPESANKLSWPAGSVGLA